MSVPYGFKLEQIVCEMLERAGMVVRRDKDLDVKYATDAIVERSDGVSVRLQITSLPADEVLLALIGKSEAKAVRFIKTGRHELFQGMAQVMLVVHDLVNREHEIESALVRIIGSVKVGEPVLVYFDRSRRRGEVTPLREAIEIARRLYGHC